MSILRRSLLLGAVACVAGAGTVLATSAYAGTNPNVGELVLNDNGALVFTAGAGVANEVSTYGTLDPIMAIEDAAAPIKVSRSAATLCKSLNDNGTVSQQPTKLVRCVGKSEHKINVVVHLGDGNDRHVAQAAFPHTPELKGAGYVVLTVHGGAGRDQLDGTSSSAPVTFYGGSGRDLMAGGEQNDFLDAGPTRLWGGQEVIGNGGTDTCRGAFIEATSCEG
jgi:Ca2+-binding RTX toxin-like protein